MIKEYKSYWKNGMNFRDRTSLSSYWNVVFVNACVAIILLIFMYLSSSGFITRMLRPGNLLEPVVPVIMLVSWPVINAVPGLAMTIRRLHDTGRSVLYYLFAFIPIAGMLILLYFLTSPTKGPLDNRYSYRRQV